MAAFLEEDETHISGGVPRYADTDEFASITRNWVLHGLTACSSTGINPSLATRGCAVLDAVKQGKLDSARLASLRKLQAEAAHEIRKADPLARAAAVSDWKTAMKTLKHHPKYRDGS